MGMFTAQARYFVGGELGLLYDDSRETIRLTIAPELGYAINRSWTVAGAIGYTYEGQEGYTENGFFFAPYVRWTYFSKGILGLHVDGGLGVSVTSSKYKNMEAERVVGFEVGFRPGLSIQITERFSVVGHVGFLGYRDAYLGSSLSGLTISGNDFGVSLYYLF